MINSLCNEIEDLYKIQLASYTYDHGVRNERRWDIFEPTKFIYAFFTFNCLYSIDWSKSVLCNELVYHDDKLGESEKINQMLYFIVENFGNDNKLKYQSFLDEFMTEPLIAYLSELSQITTDRRISEGRKSEFIKRFKMLMNKDIDDKSMRRALKEIHYFIFMVRNNIFHGSKTITDMSDRNQRKRLYIYTSILMATNEVLFEILRGKSAWNSEKVIYDITRGKIRMIEDYLGFIEKNNINIPRGSLFYPSCGDDTVTPISLFISVINDFHFVDIAKFPRLPALESVSSVNEIQKSLIRNDDKHGIIPRNIVCSREIIKDNDNYKLYKWKTQHNQDVNLHLHKADGVKTFEKIDEISVFFYRGDSSGEGGSGQWWHGKELFEKVISKINDGGLIVTDGSNPDSEYFRQPWYKRWDEVGNLSLKEKINNQDYFEYRDRRFTYLGKVQSKEQHSKATEIWQVTSA